MMHKKLLSLLLVISTLFSFAVLPANATSDENSVVQTVKALGIMVGDENGNMNLTENVTRAQITKMMVAASVYKDTISDEGSGYSLFSDLKNTHWASEYVRVALEQGWVIGYTDGTFRPEQNITLEEGCTIALRLLGYQSKDLVGSYPAAQLSKAYALNLRDQISKKQGETLSRRDCMYLFYNLLTAQTASGQIYANTLGYSVSNGQVNYNSVLIENLSGPYIADGGDTLPFTPATIYLDGETVSALTLNEYDVYYYNEDLRTVWIYTERVSGKIKALSPNSTSPTAVTVDGETYAIADANATHKLSVLGGGSTGNYVTLLLGIDDAVVGVLTGEEQADFYIGIVQSCVRALDEDKDKMSQAVTVCCTDGKTRTYYIDNNLTSFSTGRMVSVSIDNGKVSIAGLSKANLSGSIDEDVTSIGQYKISDKIEILDTTDDGYAVSLEKEDLAGRSLQKDDVRYYALDENGKIRYLVLDNASGHLFAYGYMLSIGGDLTNSMIGFESYRYLMNGQVNMHSSKNPYLTSATDGFGMRMGSDGTILEMVALHSGKITTLSKNSAICGGKRFEIVENAEVYIRQGGQYYSATLSSLSTDDYRITGWYDTFPLGKQIRVIIAEKI